MWNSVTNSLARWSVEFETNKGLYLNGNEKSAQFDATSRKIAAAVSDVRNK